ncbi:MAG: phosphoenolpyruvate--protein phosphotransferase [Betaproteobacteria bacterium]|nr:phosphoenolpyruvate--protein phosphotransferase [Betaproteobacteria bacterium]
MSFTLHGLGVSGGIAIGRALLMSHATLEVAHLTLTTRQVEREIGRLERALETVREELVNLRAQNESSAVAPSELMAFIDLHMLFLSDPELVEATKHIIRERLCNAEWALVQRMEQLVGQFDQFDDPYLRERKYDVLQVGERVIQELLGKPARTTLGKRKTPETTEENLIVVAHDLSPTDTIAFKGRHFASFVTDVGGATSHTAILARSMTIPAIVGLVSARAMIRNGEWLIVDGQRGVLIIDPDEQILDEYRIRKELLELERSKLKRLKSTISQTLDGVQISLLANIELPSDTDAVLESGADGVGLFRTEFLFLGRGDMPSEDEQFEAYRKVVKAMDGRTAVIRTFDLGGDKSLDRQRTPTNPALGRRAIRFSLAEPKMFHTQLRAILRASRYGRVKLLIPMLSHARQIDASLSAIAQAKASLLEEKIPFNRDIEIGGMIEIPGAALAIHMFLKRLSFLSIGTNDLIQYTLAIDRSDEQVASLYDSLHPAVLALIAHTLGSAEKAGIPVSVCGEMAGDPKFTRLLLGLGLRVFSMQPSQIMEIKSRIIQADVGEITPLARRILKHDETSKIEEAVEKLNLGKFGRPAGTQ